MSETLDMELLELVGRLWHGNLSGLWSYSFLRAFATPWLNLPPARQRLAGEAEIVPARTLSKQELQ